MLGHFANVNVSFGTIVTVFIIISVRSLRSMNHVSLLSGRYRMAVYTCLSLFRSFGVKLLNS